jgi:signal peptidase II
VNNRGFSMRGEINRLIVVLLGIVVDQYTKYLARANFSLPSGEPDYFKLKHILGEWLQFRLVYNTGAAFGMKPQSLISFLNPTVFYVLFSAAAIVVLALFYRKLTLHDAWQKYGVALILSGAFGNLIDRLRFQKVTDFIDVGIPSLPTRWPTFNIADSCVCVGVAMIVLAPMLHKSHRSGPVAGAGATGPTPEDSNRSGLS